MTTERFRLLRIKQVGNSLGSSGGHGIGVGGFSRFFSSSVFLLFLLFRRRRRRFFFPRFLGGWKSERKICSLALGLTLDLCSDAKHVASSGQRHKHSCWWKELEGRKIFFDPLFLMCRSVFNEASVWQELHFPGKGGSGFESRRFYNFLKLNFFCQFDLWTSWCTNRAWSISTVYTLFEIFIFCPKIQLWFHEKNCQKKNWVKTRENVGVWSKLHFWTKIRLLE